MSEQEAYEPFEILGTLITDGENVVLDMTGGAGFEGYVLGDESIFALRQELSSYGDEWADILVAKLNVIIAERELIDDEVLKMLKRRYKENQENGKSPYVFYRYEDGEPKPIKSKWYQRKWNLIKKEIGIKEKEEKKEAGYEESLQFYDLKATCIGQNASLGASILELKEISNHSSTQSLERYVRPEALKESALELMKKRNQALNGNGRK